MAGSRIFISYSHRDRVWLERLRTAIKPLLRTREISLWEDGQIAPGSRWKEELRQALAGAEAAVLLVTPEFLASDFIHDEELPVLLEAAKTRQLRVLWIPVKASAVSGTPLAQFQALYDPAKPLAELRAAARDRAMVEIASGIIKTLNDAAVPRDSLEDGLERLLGFAYNYKGPGRDFFYRVDMLWIWLHCYQRFAEAMSEGRGFSSTAAERFLSFMPSKPNDDGIEVLDDDEMDKLLDELVSRQYLTRSIRAVGECFEITDTGRAYFSANRRRIENKMDEVGTIPGKD